MRIVGEGQTTEATGVLFSSILDDRVGQPDGAFVGRSRGISGNDTAHFINFM